MCRHPLSCLLESKYLCSSLPASHFLTTVWCEQDSMGGAAASFKVVIAHTAEKTKLKSGTLLKLDVWGLQQSEVDGAIEYVTRIIATWQHRYASAMQVCHVDAAAARHLL